MGGLGAGGIGVAGSANVCCQHWPRSIWNCSGLPPLPGGLDHTHFFCGAGGGVAQPARSSITPRTRATNRVMGRIPPCALPSSREPPSQEVRGPSGGEEPTLKTPIVEDKRGQPSPDEA